LCEAVSVIPERRLLGRLCDVRAAPPTMLPRESETTTGLND